LPLASCLRRDTLHGDCPHTCGICLARCRTLLRFGFVGLRLMPGCDLRRDNIRVLPCLLPCCSCVLPRPQQHAWRPAKECVRCCEICRAQQHFVFSSSPECSLREPVTKTLLFLVVPFTVHDVAVSMRACAVLSCRAVLCCELAREACGCWRGGQLGANTFE
jgi:hypothetical protein